MNSTESHFNNLPNWFQIPNKDFKRILWFGTLSFESRCTGSLTRLVNNGVGITDALIVDYPTKVYPEEEDKKRRYDNLDLIKKICEEKGINLLDSISIEPYAFQSIQVAIKDIINTIVPDFIIFDITCLTKIHTMALAASLPRAGNGPEWSIGYTSPENYSNLTSQDPGFGWKDVIIAPLEDTALLYNEGRSRGIIILGHESDRLIVALSEVEPSGGVFISAQTKNRPDLRLLAERKNQRIIRQMMQMRLSDWTQVAVNGYAPSITIKIVDREVEIAKEYNAPILYFPFGPKPLVFTAARRLCANYSNASWFIYPLPSAYDVDYTEGIGSTSWFHEKDFLVDPVTLNI